MVFKQCQRYQKLWQCAGISLALLGAAMTFGAGQAQAQEDVEVINITIRPDPSLQAVIQAREAMHKKHWKELEAQVSRASQAPLLGSYAQYWLLRRDLRNPATPVPSGQLQHFMKTNQDAYLADRIRADWIVAAARSGDYAQALALAPVVASNTQVDCAVLLSRHMQGQPVNAEVAVDTFKPASLCWMMLDELVDKNIVGWKQLEPMLRATLETSRTSNARRIAALMFNASQMRSYAALMKNPRQWVAGQTAPKNRESIALVTLALSRLARSNRHTETAYIEKNWENAVPKANLEWVWGQFGLIAALNVEPNAVQWYRQSGNIPKTDYNHAWEVRSELRQVPIDWVRVSRAIQKMTARQQSEPVWVYWYARSLAAQGNEQAAHKHYQSIQNDYSFYGQLANEELGQPILIPPAPSPVTLEELAQARANPGLQRAIKLFDLGWRAEAVPEWNFTLRGMTDRQLLAAAELAHEEQIFDRVVNTSLRTTSVADFAQRFVAPFEGRVTEKAHEIDLDPAWVYGLIRQESRFITNARSRVGASGLMQLMPATARWVARRIGMSDFHPSMVNDFDINTILGTQYLKMVLDDLDGKQVLATAGYNAGPGRSRKWRAKLLGSVEGAVFTETIPFTETRLYVKHVMSNAVYYSMLFTGQPQSLKARLDIISPETSRRTNLP